MKNICTLLLFLTTATALRAQTVDDRINLLEKRTGKLEAAHARLGGLSLSGYIQTQWQWGQQDASLKVGSPNGGDGQFNRIGIRRGRLKLGFDKGIASAVFQIDLTEKGVGIKDAYLNLRDPWIGSMALKVGLFNRPFGYEIEYSSSRRESPERSTVFQTLFPEERDLGAMLTFQAPQSSPWNILKLEAGLVAGNGIKTETDNRKDFIGRLSVGKTYERFSFGAGASYYNGGVYQSSTAVYRIKDGVFTADERESNLGAFARREYFGIDARLSIATPLGTTWLRGEYISGTQPGTEGSSKSPNSSALPSGKDTYIRNFGGGYAMIVQSIGRLPVSAVVKYDIYDPNTRVSGDEIGLGGTGYADMAVNTLGMGGLWDINKNIRLQAYYELVGNERSDNLEGADRNIKDNAFTLRLQYKF